MMKMKPLAELSKQRLRALFTDLDDTLTTQQKIPAGTYQALWRLKEKGVAVIIVSGRPAGWADCLMRLFPLDAMIFENGAGWVCRQGDRFCTEIFAQPADRKRLKTVYDELKLLLPHLKLAQDQPYRLFDMAIDYAEDPPYLTRGELEQVLQRLKAQQGITAKLSSIHVNYWCGEHTKVTAVERWLSIHGKAQGIDRAHSLFCGDSPNDEPLFAFFEKSVGVANITRFVDGMKHSPSHVTSRCGGEGFEELVNFLLTD